MWKYKLLLLIALLSFLWAQTWEEQAKIVPAIRHQNTNFGFCVDIYGDYAVVGARWDDYDANDQDREAETGAVYVYKQEEGEWVQKQKLIASDRTTWDQFGTDVAIWGDYIVIGAPNDNLRDDGELSSQSAGAAYVFQRDGEEWVQLQKLTASDRATLDNFGWYVDIHDGFIIISALGSSTDENGQNYIAQSGAAYIFEKAGGMWTEVKKITAPVRKFEGYFANRVKVNNEYAMISYYRDDMDTNNENSMVYAGAVYIYHYEDFKWKFSQKVTASDRSVDDRFGRGLAVSDNYMVVGAEYDDTDQNGLDSVVNAGSAYIFKKEGTGWVEKQKIVHLDREEYNYYGTNCDITDDYVLVGSHVKDKHLINNTTLSCTGAAYMYKREGESWNQIQKLVAFEAGENDRFGFGLALSEDHAIVGAQNEDEDENEENYMANCGSAYIYQLSKLTKIEAPVDYTFNSLYPNPANTSVFFEYETLISTDIRMDIYNLFGRSVRHFDTGLLPKGIHTISWDGRDNNGNCLPSGVYICSMASGLSRQVKKMVLLK